MKFAHEINRALLRFHVDPADIFAQHADADELDASEKCHGDKDRGVARHCISKNERSKHDEHGI